jgi:hypothetical protein
LIRFGTTEVPVPNFGNTGDGILIQSGSDNIVSGVDATIDRYSPNAILQLRRRDTSPVELETCFA